jgi:cyclopropane fatty-acyl-phospholipid synthase-like methyltransferase
VLALARPLGLTPSATLLDVSAGLGGPARVIAETHGVSVWGLERDPMLASLGMAMSVAVRLGRRVPIGVYDPEGFNLALAQYDAVIGREATYTVRDKERFLRVLMQGLKPQGALLLTEFVLDRSVGDRQQLAAWGPLPGYPPYLWTLERYEDCLRSLGFALHATEDISADYRARVVAGWTRLARMPELRLRPRAHLLPILEEAERAMRTVEALDSGALKLVRIEADARRG